MRKSVKNWRWYMYNDDDDNNGDGQIMKDYKSTFCKSFNQLNSKHQHHTYFIWLTPPQKWSELELPNKMNSFNFRAYLQIDGQTYVPIRNNWILISFSLTYISFDFNIINGKEEKIRCAHHHKQRKVFKRHLCTK